MRNILCMIISRVLLLNKSSIIVGTKGLPAVRSCGKCPGGATIKQCCKIVIRLSAPIANSNQELF